MNAPANIPCLPGNAPFTPEQRAWLNGFLAGLFSAAQSTQPSAPEPANLGSLLIMFGSQTGTAEALARKIGAEAKKRGVDATVLDMAAHARVDWAKQSRVLLVTSTWGDGEPPDNALSFYNLLTSAPPPDLKHLTYAVLALGDSNYPSFCGAGQKFDAALEKLGAARIQARAECDLDYQPVVTPWLESMWCKFGGGAAALVDTLATATKVESHVGHTRTNPFSAALLKTELLNSSGSAKETRSFEFDATGLTYEAGDAVGVWPQNNPRTVEGILQTLGFNGSETVCVDGSDLLIAAALLGKFEITRIPRELLATVSERTQIDSLRAILESEEKQALDKLLYGWDLLDLFTSAPGLQLTPEELVGSLKRLQPRLYSISSSPKAHAGQVHLTVSIVRFEVHGRWRGGVCSTFLADHLSPGAAAPLFIHKSPHFRLPGDSTTPIIMVGPGTGIAPFRSFLHERLATGASGPNWLFFGDQRSSTDFLYREELETLQKNGALQRLDLAFSRDQPAKVYVQDKMRESASELWKWLEQGAHFYVCGDAKRMARDVDSALHEVVQIGGKLSVDKAAEYVQQLRAEKRYQRDVY